MKALLNSLLICLLASFAGVALAQTPDGETPAEEDVCDGLIGAAFGLCNAYCEAMDCHYYTDGDPATEPQASEIACDRVRSKFHKHVGDDEILPCERVTLTINTVGDGAGTVTTGVSGEITCGAGGTDCDEDYASGTPVVLTATADSGSTFVGWTANSDADCSDGALDMPQNTFCEAEFGTDGPPPPPATCPCVSGTNWGDEDAGLIWEDFANEFSLPTTCTDAPPLTEIEEDLGEGDFVRISVDDPAGTGAFQCAAADSFGTSGTVSVTAAEAAVCAEILRDLAAVAGTACGS